MVLPRGARIDEISSTCRLAGQRRPAQRGPGGDGRWLLPSAERARRSCRARLRRHEHASSDGTGAQPDLGPRSAEITHFEFNHAEIDAPILRESPFAAMLRDGVAERRCDLTDPATVKGVPVFEELHAAGMTEWQGRVFPVRRAVAAGRRSDRGRARRAAVAGLLAHDRPSGRLSRRRHGGAAAGAAGVRRRRQGRHHARDRARAAGRLSRRRSGEPRLRRHRACAAKCRASRPSCSTPTCAASPHLPTPRRARTLIALLDECFELHGPAGRAARRRGAEVHGRRPARGLSRLPGEPRRGLRAHALDAATEVARPDRGAQRPAAGGGHGRRPGSICRCISARCSTAMSAPPSASTSR